MATLELFKRWQMATAVQRVLDGLGSVPLLNAPQTAATAAAVVETLRKHEVDMAETPITPRLVVGYGYVLQWGTGSTYKVTEADVCHMMAYLNVLGFFDNEGYCLEKFMELLPENGVPCLAKNKTDMVAFQKERASTASKFDLSYYNNPATRILEAAPFKVHRYMLDLLEELSSVFEEMLKKGEKIGGGQKLLDAGYLLVGSRKVVGEDRLYTSYTRDDKGRDYVQCSHTPHYQAGDLFACLVSTIDSPKQTVYDPAKMFKRLVIELEEHGGADWKKHLLSLHKVGPIKFLAYHIKGKPTGNEYGKEFSSSVKKPGMFVRVALLMIAIKQGKKPAIDIHVGEDWSASGTGILGFMSQCKETLRSTGHQPTPLADSYKKAAAACAYIAKISRNGIKPPCISINYRMYSKALEHPAAWKGEGGYESLFGKTTKAQWAKAHEKGARPNKKIAKDVWDAIVSTLGKIPSFWKMMDNMLITSIKNKDGSWDETPNLRKTVRWITPDGVMCKFRVNYVTDLEGKDIHHRTGLGTNAVLRDNLGEGLVMKGLKVHTDQIDLLYMGKNIVVHFVHCVDSILKRLTIVLAYKDGVRDGAFHGHDKHLNCTWDEAKQWKAIRRAFFWVWGTKRPVTNSLMPYGNDFFQLMLNGIGKSMVKGKKPVESKVFYPDDNGEPKRSMLLTGSPKGMKNWKTGKLSVKGVQVWRSIFDKSSRFFKH